MIRPLALVVVAVLLAPIAALLAAAAVVGLALWVAWLDVSERGWSWR